MGTISPLKQVASSKSCGGCDVGGCATNQKLSSFPENIQTMLDSLSQQLNSFNLLCGRKAAGGAVSVDGEIIASFEQIFSSIQGLRQNSGVYPELDSALNSLISLHANEVFEAILDEISK